MKKILIILILLSMPIKSYAEDVSSNANSVSLSNITIKYSRVPMDTDTKEPKASDLSLKSLNNDISLGYGLGIFNSAKNSPSEVKVGNLSYRYTFYNSFYWQTKGGFWGDGTRGEGRKSSGYFSTGPGIKIDFHPVELRTGWSIATITTPDSYLGGPFPQFQGEAYGGLRDKNNNAIGLQYEHISSAGIIRPNEGRDFLMLVISHGW